MNNQSKQQWVSPQLHTLDVKETLTGAVLFPIEIFDGDGNPVGGPDPGPGPS